MRGHRLFVGGAWPEAGSINASGAEKAQKMQRILSGCLHSSPDSQTKKVALNFTKFP